MESLVIYDSKFGNTKKVAEAVADGLGEVGPVRLVGVGGILPQDLGSADLLILGCPTHSHGLSQPMRRFLDSIQPWRKQDLVAGVFDTRYRAPGVFTGSAARLMATRLRKAGIRLLLPAESFFVTREEPPALERGELDRARDWGRELVARLEMLGWYAA